MKNGKILTTPLATQYSQLPPCEHPAITDTPIIRTAAKFPAKPNFGHLSEINSRYYRLSLVRTLTRGPYCVRIKGSWLYQLLMHTVHCRNFLLKFQVICENLKAEKALMKESEVRLMQENKSLLEHQKSQNALVTNLQTLQVSCHCTNNKGLTQPPWWWQWKHLQKIELAFFQTLSYLFSLAQFVKSRRIFLELIF